MINDRPAGIHRNSDLPASLYSLIPNRCIANCAPGQTPVLLRDLLNHVNFDRYSGVVTSPFFGQSSQARPARSIEFNFRFSF